MEYKASTRVVKPLLIMVFVPALIFSYFYTLVTLFVIPVYHYESASGVFQDDEYPTKGWPLERVTSAFEGYKDTTTITTDTTLFRTFKPNYLNIWRLNHYLTHPRYQFPYKDRTDGIEE